MKLKGLDYLDISSNFSDDEIMIQHSVREFVDKEVAPIIDDHLFINQMANFPCIDIVHYDPMAKNSFGDYWHTHDDNIEVIDKQTLDAVGQTLMGVIKSEGLN